MELSGILETKGFTFQLKDMCPKSLIDTNWRATFLKDGETFSAENPQSAPGRMHGRRWSAQVFDLN